MGTSWEIKEIKKFYQFTLFNFFNEGYRFTLDKNKMYNFGLYLLNCCDYMLKHGESI